MNLQKFLDYQKSCPICMAPSLYTYFHSRRKQENNINNNRFSTLFVLKDMGANHSPTEVEYSIGLNDNSLQIDFYNFKIKIDPVPLTIIKRFITFHTNLKGYRIYRSCDACRRYRYSSNIINLDLKNNCISSLKVDSEYWALYKSFTSSKELEYKIFYINNDYIKKNTVIDVCFTKDIEHTIDLHMLSSNPIKTNIIKFTTQSETFERINKLLALL